MRKTFITRGLTQGQMGRTKGGFKFSCEFVFRDFKPQRKYLIAIYPDPRNLKLKIMATLDELGRHMHNAGQDDYGVELGRV